IRNGLGLLPKSINAGSRRPETKFNPGKPLGQEEDIECLKAEMTKPMSREQTTAHDLPFTRRELLRRRGMGFGMLGLAGLLGSESFLTQARAVPAGGNPLAPKTPHFPGRARRVVHLFMNGGPSQVDTFDPKPLLDRYHGRPLPQRNLRTERKTGAAMRSPYTFPRYRQRGIESSEMFRRTAAPIDDKTFVPR